jgi:hypothetical protein
VEIDPLTNRRPVWCQVVVPPSYGLPAEVVLERRWIDADGRQWRSDDRPLDPAPIVKVG